MKALLLCSAVLFSLFLFNCSDNRSGVDPCYDCALVHNDACTKDCPGFLGCDGKTYCNFCEAARVGIGPN